MAKVNSISVFTPNSLQQHDTNPFNFQLLIDKNKASVREIHKVYSQIRTVRNGWKDYNFYCIFQSLDNDRKHIKLLAEAGEKIRATIFYQHQCNDRRVREKLLKDYPFLQTQKNSSFHY